MSEPTLRAALFALASQIDRAADRVVFSDWTQPRSRREVETTLAENATLNLFLTPRAAPAAAEHVAALVRKGLLLPEADWQQERARHPYMNFPSLQADLSADARPFGSYEEAYAHDFAPWNRLPVATDLLSLVPLPGHDDLRVLDVGCGTGHNLDLIEQLGLRCWGIDISATAVARARAKTAHPERFVTGSVSNLPWPEAHFDVVIDIGCLHCLEPADISAYVLEVRRVLAPGGRFLCRCFKPREERVVRAQPVKMDRLGYTPDEVAAFFAGALPVKLVKEGPVHGFYLGQA